ncbi:MAG TPA: E3 binding domain-containing protein [Sporichthya sp.]|nr:E3 binding domain-containing protein [Sporichthya sp.]
MPFPSPLVRRLARDNDVDAGTVMGTGVGGRVQARADGTSE